MRTLVLTLLIAALAMVWGFVTYDSVQHKERIREHNQQERQAMAQTLAEHTRAILHRIDAVLLSLRQIWQLQNGGFAAALSEHQAHLNDVSLQVSVIDADGSLEFTNLGKPESPVFLGDRKHYLAHVSAPGDHLYVGAPVKGRVSNKWAVQLSRRLIVNRQFGGVMVASVDPGHFARFHSQASLGPDIVVTLVRDTGEFLSRSEKLNDVLGKSATDFPFLKPDSAAVGWFEHRAMVDGLPRLSAWHRLPEFGLTVVVSESKRAVETRVAAGDAARIGLGAVLSAAWIALAWLLLRGVESRTRARRALELSEDRFQRFFRASPTPHVLTRMDDGRYVAINDAFARLFEIPEAKAVGRTSSAMGFWVDPAERKRFFDLARSQGNVDRFETRHRSATGRIFAARQSTVVVTVDEEPHLISTIVDISDEIALREMHARVDAIVASAMDAIVTCDENQRIIVFNAAAAKMFGLPAEEALGSSLERFIPTRLRPGHGDHMRRFAEEKITNRGMGRAGEILALHVDGHEFPVEASISHVQTEGKSLYSVIMRDISVRVASQRALAEASRRYESLVEGSFSGVILLHGRTIGYANARFAQIFGFDASPAAAGTDLLALAPPAYQRRIRKALQWLAARPNQSMPPRQLRMLRRDGTVIDAEVSASSIEIEGRTLIQAELRDITNERRALAQIRALNQSLEARIETRTAELTVANRELAATNRDLESFSYSVAHDLRSPLRSMVGFAQLLQMDIAEKTFDEVDRHAARIAEGASRMNALIDGLLAVARVTHGVLVDDRVDMRVLAAEAVREAGAAPSARVSIGPLPEIRGDKASLRQVWANLISNAVKYSSKRATPEISIGCERVEGEIIFHVKDNGAGFDPAHVSRLFGVFQRLHAKDEFDGTGVGLAIVSRIVERHGGRTWAEGRIDAGAAFYFALPAARLTTTTSRERTLSA